MVLGSAVDYGGLAVADVLYLALTLLFVAASLIFIVVCERLMEDKP